ncbi:THF1 [Auxenochlorella protothecoides x Auxenochlorella symbiontica]|uniref:Protein THYLAKOID FORMATION1, chloroplastic n=1 Tax=Auxenochlorella protothecoides TaxID=3075 RepID=A0A1D2ABP6_AUXPR
MLGALPCLAVAPAPTTCLRPVRSKLVFQASRACPRRSLRSAVSMKASTHEHHPIPPTVADTKAAFLEGFKRPLPGIYSTVIQELLVQQHLFRWNVTYSYNAITALGVVSIFDQLLEGLPEQDPIFEAFIKALQEDPAQYRGDARRLEEAAGSLGGPENLKPDAEGSEIQKTLAQTAEAIKSGNFLYTRFFAVGLFRLLELAGAKGPKALSGLTSALGVPLERVNADLLTYKNVLSKLQAAKEIMKEFLEREKKKTAQRLAEKQAKQAAQSGESADGKAAEVAA